MKPEVTCIQWFSLLKLLINVPEVTFRLVRSGHRELWVGIL